MVRAMTSCAYILVKHLFDKVPYQKLLKKVRARGIDGKILGWIKAWLSDRRHRVVINGSNSEASQIISGVPQG